jgi:hypothetical protein
MGVVYIPTLNEGERLVVIITIAGPVSPKQAEEWTRKIEELKALGIKIEGVTLRAEPLRGGGSAR